MNIDLSDEETAALARLLSKTIDDDRYPLSPRIQMLKAIREDPTGAGTRAFAAVEVSSAPSRQGWETAPRG